MATATTEKKEKTVKTPALKVEAVHDGIFAIIETGGKQYGVTTGATIKIEKIKGALTKDNRETLKVGDLVSFDKVVLLDGASFALGAPYVTGSKVTGTISEIGRNQKVTVIKYKQKSRYFKKNGHRQPFFKVLINSIA